METFVSNKIYFVGKLNPSSAELFNCFKEQWEVVRKISDFQEIEESLPEQKCIFIFSEAKQALEFLSEQQPHKNNFLGLISEREGKYQDNVMEIFEQNSLYFYTPKLMEGLIRDVNEFLLGPLVEPEDIEFSIHMELETD